MITQSELARLAGVSQKTVNRALAGHVDVNPETRERIRQLAENNGYLPNQAACAIRAGRSGNIGMLISEKPYVSYLPLEMLGFLKQELSSRHLNLLISSMNDREFSDRNIISGILSRMICDGIMINYNYAYPDILPQMLSRYHIPHLWLNERRPCNCIYHHEFQAGVSATRHLLQYGHRRIAFFNFSGTDHHSRTDRRDGYAQTMREAGLTPSIHESAHSLEASLRYDAIRSALSDTGINRPTAVIAFLDDLPVTCAVARELRLAIPQDLSLVTCGITQIHFLDLNVVTIGQREDEFCRRAVAMLIERIADPDIELPPCAIETHLIAGNSCAEKKQ